MFPLDEIPDHLHRTGAIQCIHCHKIADAGGLQLAQPILHAGAFELEYGNGIATRKQVERLLIVLGEMVDINLDPVVLFDHR